MEGSRGFDGDFSQNCAAYEASVLWAFDTDQALLNAFSDLGLDSPR